jgi:hypothetical protein
MLLTLFLFIRRACPAGDRLFLTPRLIADAIIIDVGILAPGIA